MQLLARKELVFLPGFLVFEVRPLQRPGDSELQNRRCLCVNSPLVSIQGDASPALPSLPPTAPFPSYPGLCPPRASGSGYAAPLCTQLLFPTVCGLFLGWFLRASFLSPGVTLLCLTQHCPCVSAQEEADPHPAPTLPLKSHPVVPAMPVGPWATLLHPPGVASPSCSARFQEASLDSRVPARC